MHILYFRYSSSHFFELQQILSRLQRSDTLRSSLQQFWEMSSHTLMKKTSRQATLYTYLINVFIVAICRWCKCNVNVILQEELTTYMAGSQYNLAVNAGVWARSGRLLTGLLWFQTAKFPSFGIFDRLICQYFVFQFFPWRDSAVRNFSILFMHNQTSSVFLNLGAQFFFLQNRILK